MTKKFLAFALVASAVCITACQPKDNPVGPQDGKSLVVNPHEVVLTAEAPNIRLSATLTPDDATATIAWSSSDTTVAVVTSRGYVEATGYGDCYIYASFGDMKDSCHVFVKTFLEAITFNNAYMDVLDTTDALDPETGEYIIDSVTASDGITYPAYKVQAKWELYSDGFYIDNTGHFAGTEKGVILEFTAPMYYATAYLLKEEKGAVFCLGDWAITAKELASDVKISKPGYVDEAEYIAEMKQFVEAYNAEDNSFRAHLQAAAEHVHAPLLNTYTYSTEGDQAGYSYSYIPDAFVTEGLFTVSNEDAVSKYMYKLDYSTFTFTQLDLFWGMNIEKDEEGVLTLIDEDIHYADPVTVTYGVHPTSEAKRYTKVSEPAYFKDASFQAKHQQEIKDKNIRVIRAKF